MRRTGSYDNADFSRIETVGDFVQQSFNDVSEIIMSGSQRVRLNPMQVAYLLGGNEGLELGGQATFVYCEATLPCDACTAARLLEAVMARHDVFSCRIDHETAEVVHDLPTLRRAVRVHEPSLRSDSDHCAAEVRGRLWLEAKRSNGGQWLYGAETVARSEGTSLVCFFFNMIIMDAASTFVLMYELSAMLRDEVLPEPVQYLPTARALEQRWTARFRQRSRDYWAGKAAALPSAPRFAPGAAVYEEWSTCRYSTVLPSGVLHAAASRAKAQGISLSTVILAAHAAVIARWANNPSFTVNMTLTERRRDPLDQILVGDFTSSLLVGVDVAGHVLLDTLAQQVHQNVVGGLRHRAFSGVEVIQEFLRPHGDLRAAAMPVVFTSFLRGEGGNHTTDIDVDYVYTQTGQVFLDIQVLPWGDSATLSWDYVPEYFGFSVSHMFEAAVATFASYARGEAVLPVIDRFMADEIETYNYTDCGFSGGTLLGSVKDSFVKYADRIALVSHVEGLSYTYADLDRLSAQLAHYLVHSGCKPGDVITVESTKHPMSVINQLAILRAGCIFLPVNAHHPAERKKYMGERAGASKIVLTDSSYEATSAGQYPQRFEDIAVSPESPAYIIFTSGSTGQPKGVEISHTGAVNTINDIATRFYMSPDDVVIGLSALSFDLSIYDIYGTFGVGATLTLVHDQRDADEILSILEAHHVTIWNSSPALVELTLLRAENEARCESLRLLMMSGDRIAHDLPARCAHLFPHAAVYSLGGATEGSIWSIIHPLDGKPDPTTIPYGRPLANQTMYVLGYDLRLCPMGVPGEIYIGGAGVALSYRGDPDRTNEAFITVEPYGRLYRTGDLGVFNDRKYIDFLGRKDRQMKIHGHRVELGEIEAVLGQNPEVRLAEVALVEYRGSRAIVAFVVPNSTGKPDGQMTKVDSAALLHLARGFLPDYMIPQLILVVDAIPVTSHGKVDHAALQRLVDDRADQGLTRSCGADPARAATRAIWERVLGVPVTDDERSFFACGGDSLKFQELLRIVYEVTGHRLRFRDVVVDPTVRNVHRLLEHAAALSSSDAALSSDDAAEGVLASDRTDGAEGGPYDPFPLTEMQRAYLIGRGEGFALGGVSEHYYIESENVLDIERLEDAFNALIERHAMLRAVIDDDGTQRILPSVPRYRIEVRDVSRLGPDEIDAAVAERRAELSHHVFALGTWPQYGLSAFALGHGRYYLFFNVDMILADGASQRILVADLTRLYDGEEPLPLEGSFRDYVVKLSRDRRNVLGSLTEEGLADIVGGFPVGNILPESPGFTSGVRTTIRRLSHTFDVDEVQQLRRRVATVGVSLSALFCAGYAASLGLWATTPRVGINVTTYNRDPQIAEIRHVVGDFTGSVLLSFDAAPPRDIFVYAQDTQRVLLEHLDDSYSGIRVISEIARRNNAVGQAVAPFVFTSLLFDDEHSGAAGPGGSVLGELRYAVSQTPQVLLDNQVVVVGGRIEVAWDYVESFFDAEMMVELFGHYVATVQGCIRGDAVLPPIPSGSVVAVKNVLFPRISARKVPSQGARRPVPVSASPGYDSAVATVVTMAQQRWGLSRLEPGDSLFDAGLDSMRFIAFVKDVESVSSRRIPLAAALDRPTAMGIATLIAQDTGGVHSGDDDPGSENSLVWLRAGTGVVRALFVHGGFGSVDIYRDLALAVPESWDVWGLRFDPLATSGPRELTIEDIAECYRREVDRRFSPGEFLLIVGWSLGGTIAVELALQLHDRYRVELVLLDSLAPGPRVDVGAFSLDEELRLLQPYINVDEVLASSVPSGVGELWARVEAAVSGREEESVLVHSLARSISSTLVEDLGAAGTTVMIRQLSALRTLIRARNVYVPTQRVSRALAICASDGEAWNIADWHRHVLQRFELVELDGNHYSILLGGAARSTADALTGYLARADAELADGKLCR